MPYLYVIYRRYDRSPRMDFRHIIQIDVDQNKAYLVNEQEPDMPTELDLRVGTIEITIQK